MELHLVSHYPREECRTLLLEGRPLSIGRHSDSDVCITDPEISRHHCEMDLIDGLPLVRDLESSNGTFVNGLQIAEATLRPGDVLTLARRTFLVHYSRDAMSRALSGLSQCEVEGGHVIELQTW